MESNLVQNLVNLKSLPETWAVKDFKEVVSDNSGGNKKLAKSNFLNEGEIAVVDQGKKLIAGYYNDTSLAVKTQPPYVIFGDHTRAFKYVDFPFIMGADGTKVLQPKKGNCTTKYLYYFFLSINVPNTGYNRHFKYLKNLKIPLPPLDQQKKIADILDAADAYRQKTKALIEKYDELTQSLFLDMFGDPVSNPKGWLKLKLSEFCEFENGDRSSNYPSGDDIKKSGKLFLSSGDIKNGRFRVKDSKYISQEKFDSLKRGKCRTGDVLMTLRGNGTGKSAVFNCEFKEGFINAQMVILRPDERCISDYLVLQLNCPPVFKRLINLNSGSAQPQLSASNVKDFEVFVPEIDLQNQFAERVQAIEAQKAQVQASLAQADDLFNSLLQRAFKGELT